MKNKNLLILSTLVLVASFTLANPAHAQAQNAAQNGETLVQRIMKAFKLNQTEVDKVVTQYRTEKQAEMQKRYEERLNTLVSEGTITAEQKNKIMAKHQEMLKDKPDYSNMTPQERQAEREEHREEMHTWAEQNGINLQYLMMGNDGKGFGKNGGRGLGQGQSQN